MGTSVEIQVSESEVQNKTENTFQVKFFKMYLLFTWRIYFIVDCVDRLLPVIPCDSCEPFPSFAVSLPSSLK